MSLFVFTLLSVCSENPQAGNKKSCANLKAYFADIAGRSAFGPYQPFKYLQGKYTPKAKFETWRGLKLREETMFALKCMLAEYEGAYNHKIKLISGFRSFEHQGRIWNKKFDGKRKGYGDCPKISPNKCADKILRFSSMPGTSRHHWGTDVDLFSLNNDYFKKGQGKVFFLWLKNNAGKFGFCQPYTAGRDLSKGGYQEERWHWSFTPLSKRLLAGWNKKFTGQGILGFSGTSGKRKVKDLDKLQYQYVNNIDPACK